uniref:MBG domain-containing protein n=1 Tax=uncultured Catenibacterium sp. TaxID=286142 RepID=UPI0025FDB905
YFGPIKNCYYLADTEDENGGKTTAQFASGEIAYLLSQGCTVGGGEGENAVTYSGSVWGQALGENGDTYPVLDITKRVYQVDKYDGCEGKPGSSTKVYSNQSTSIYEEHKYEADTTDSTKHKCSICNGTEEHSFAYELVENGNAIKATCSECGATYTVKLTQPAATSDEKIVYDGTEKKAGTAIDSGNTGIETIPENAITYATVTNGTPSTYSTTAPKNAGTYKAKFTLGTGNNIVSIEISFTIEKATPTLNWADNATEKTIIYTGNAITADNLPAIIAGLQKDEEYKGTVMYSYSKISDNNISGNDEFSDGLPDRFPEEVGSTYKVKARIEATDNYTAAESDILTLKVGYLDGKNIPDAIIEEWNEYKTITLKAPDGYYISLTPENTTAGKVEYTSTSGNEEDTVTYYLQRISDKAIAEKTITVKYDKAAPDWSGNESGIRIKSTWWNKLLSSVTFGLYKGGSLDVYAKANDSQSGVAEYYYYIDNSGSTTTLTAEELGTKTFTKVDADKNGTTKLTDIASDNNYVIYAYAVDAAGNRSIYISSDGVVLDNTAPKLTNVSVPAKSNETLSDTSAIITFTGSEAGTYYYILKENKENGEPAPTEMSNFATKTAGDKVDTWTAKDGVSTGTLTADEANTIKLTGLKANTGYVLYLAATDAAGNASVAESAGADGDSGVVSVSFTTAKMTPYVKTAPVLSGTYGNTVSAMFEKADMTTAVVTAGRNSDTKVEGTWTLASEDADKLPTVGTSKKYTLVFTPAGSDAATYDSVTCEVTPVVSKKQITVVIADKEKLYRETNTAFTWSLATGDAYQDNVLVAADTEEALGISLSTTAKDNSGVGNYAITGTSNSANYEVSFTGSGSDGKSGILTVKQAANSFTTKLSCSDYAYAKDETPKPNATAKFGTVTYKYATAASDGTAYKAPSDESAYTDAIPVNAGIYAVKAYVAEKDNYAGLASDPVVFTINKAASPNIGDEEKSYTYAAGSDGKAISVDIAGKLPTDRGTTAYALTKTNNEQLLSDVAVDQGGNLTYTVNEADKSQVGAAATITVTASMLNYEDAVYTMTIRITDKKLVTLKSGNTVSVNGSNALTYGDKLSKLGFSEVTFVEADTDTEVKGTLEWADPDCIPTAGTTHAGWVFKPTDNKHYEELTGTADITVDKATPAVVTVPTVAERVYNPAVALADSDMTGASVTGADGSSLAGTWSFTGKNIIPTVNNKGYQAVFTPDDTNNYNTVTETITVKVTKATPVIAEKPTAGALTYGQKLSESKLTGGKAAYQTADGTEITGTFAWKNSSSKPTAADSQKKEYDATFTPSDKDNYNAVDTKIALTVNKAALAALLGESRSYIYAEGSNNKAETMDVAGKLPEDRGNTTFTLATEDTDGLLSDVKVDTDGKLSYKVKQLTADKAGKSAAITVTASMLNYEDAVYTMTIRIMDKKLVALKSVNKVSVNGSNALTYGDKLSKLGFSEVTFVEADTDTEVEGTLEWADPDCMPTAGTTQAGWVFKPADSKHYEELTGTADITVDKATPAVVTVPTVAERVYNPALALADSDMTGGSVTGADGSSLAGTWSFTGKNIIPTVNNKGYKAVFTPADTNNYKTVTGKITVKVTKATPVIAEKPTAGALTYGQKLSDSTLTGGKAAYQTADETEITGTFAWKNSSNKPTAADSEKTEYDVTFTPSDKDNYNAVDTKIALTVNKAALATLSSESRSYIYAEGSNDKAETMDVAGKLPEDRGTTAYSLTKTYNEQLLSDVSVDQDGNLTYKVNEADKSQVGDTATITVLASMENYEDAVYTMTIRITDKKLVTLKSGNTVSVNGSNALTYGDKLSKLGFSEVTFVEADTDTEVKGTLEWADPDCIPTAGTTHAGWVFKPTDNKHYEELTGTADITVDKATPAVVTVPTVAERVYNPAVALADSDMTGGSVTGADGNSLAGTWSFTGTNIIPTVNNKGYQAVFKPDDTNNYNTVTKTITVKVTKATPVIAEKPTAGALTYGQKLSDSTLTGGKAACQTVDGTEITGTFAWKNGSSKPTAADSQKTEYDVTFTPSDKDNYNAVDTKIAITVNKASQAPNMPQASMAPAHSTKKVGDITLPDGWSWQEVDKDVALADGVAVTANAFYTGTDKGNYEIESVSITITRSKCEHTHTEIRNQREATCKEEGYTGDTYCKDCGEKLDTGTTIEKKPHTVGTTATCVSKAVCSVCGETFGEVDANNHVHATVKNRKEATCTQSGYTGDTYCTDCNKLLGTGTELAALGHEYKATVTKQPTTTEEGIRTYTCIRCNSSYTESIAKLPEQHKHEYTETVTKEPTCTDTGIKTFTCSCGDSYTKTIPALGHSYTSMVTKAATITEEGIMTYTCSKCGHSYTQPIAKLKIDNGNDNGTSKPYIKDDSGKEGWDVIKPQLEKAKSGETVTVAMNGTSVVPKTVIDSIKGKDTTLVLDMGNGLSWKINGKEITDATGDIDFSVTIGADAGKSIPVDVINKVSGEKYSMNLSLAYDGEFGFTATLTVNMDPKNSGMYANLFYYNEQTGKLEFISAGQIYLDGNVELAFTHASDYTIVVAANIMSNNSQADNNADETIPAPKTDDSISKYAWNNTIIIIIGICIILVIFGAVFYVRKKSGSEEE